MGSLPPNSFVEVCGSSLLVTTRAGRGGPRRSPSWSPPLPFWVRNPSSTSISATVLTPLDYFLRENRPAMRQLVAELFNPATTLEYQHATPEDILRAMQLDQKFHELEIGLVDGV